ncbi:acetate kinase [Chromobacterium sphagni]|uniref:Acetate kinase n=1 Tax=Chromobacterium sphagni TaxID=1903179 RepID=A0A1S1X6E7_9NEIS|nr:acetate kinase [Chromobacterium sphagni]OHX15039.1 acetate kinase [Chromobacterium sphagni]OHX15470.1 acetate kinase [Chromobacterium sphagni]
MNSSILVINCGSSSLKFALIDSQNHQACLTGLAEKLGLADAYISFKFNGAKDTLALQEGNHSGAMHAILEKLQQLSLLDSVKAIGHRVVHGGEVFKESALITDEVIAEIERCAKLAPLHNPAHLLGIRTAIEQFPGLPQTVVFDTSFHQTMPRKAYLYAVPMSLYREHNVRRYGFHGTSYRYVAAEAAKMLGKPLEETAMVCAHLGNGASATAILGGKGVDTTMGLTPLEGLVMGTRSGDIDGNIFSYLASELGLDINGVTDLLNKKSGLLGLSELSNDCRELEEAAQNGHQGAIVALEVFAYRLAKHIAALTVALGRLDALLFTGGIGENSSFLREAVIKQLGFLGLKLDDDANRACIRGNAGRITTADSVPALVINTDEELMIAQDTARLVGLGA